jgi:tetratricopeptide (TPR) repeat protein
MRAHLFCVALLSLALPVLTLEPVHAAESGAATSEYEEHVEHGIALRRSGQDREALAAFQRAELMSPYSARVQVHLAGTYQALGDWLRADEYLKRALAQPSDPFVQRHRDTLDLAQQTIADHIGLLEIEGSPAGAEVRLDGEIQGTLPLAQPIRTLAGAYTLDLSRPGYYRLRRPVTVFGARLTREVVNLAADAGAPGSAPQTSGVARDGATGGGANWLPWTLGGLGVAAAGVSTLAWLSRERHAERWNDDDRCQRPGLTRAAVCGAERAASQRAEATLLVSAAAAGLFAAGAVLSVVLSGPSPREAERAQLACGLKGVWVTCAAQF